MEIIVDADCGNAPKKALVRDWLIAAVESDPEAVENQLCDEARLEVVGAGTHQGRDAVTAAVTHTDQVAALRIALLLSHGKHVAAEGQVRHGDGTTQALRTC